MSILAVKGIPQQWSLVKVVQAIAKLVAGPFEPLNFEQRKAQNKKITCYLRLSERLDPIRVVERINSATIGPKGLKFEAFVPENVPDLPIVEKKFTMPKFKKRVRPTLQPYQVVLIAHLELYTELQFHFPSLYNLSYKTGHKLLDEISKTICDRLKRMVGQKPAGAPQCFSLTAQYRSKYPHSGDFELVKSTLHRLQDASGAPRRDLSEAELLQANANPLVIEDIPLAKVRHVCKQFGERISAAVKEHVQSLDSEITSDDTEEVIARKKVREELKKMLPYLPPALKQVISSHFIPDDQQQRKIRIYGEPYLPGREAMLPFTKQYNTVGSRIIRSRHMYNLLMFTVASEQYAALRAMNATVIKGAKLTIRSDTPTRRVDPALRKEIAEHFGETLCEADLMEIDDEFEEENELQE